MKLGQDDLDLTYDDVISMYQNEELAMYFGTSAMVKTFQDQGIDTAFLPFFNQNGEKWIMTTPYFQIALNKDLEQDDSRRKKAMKVLKEMMSEEAQNLIIADGQDMLSYSQDVDFYLTEYLKDIKTVIEENHMYIRIASNDFFSISKDVVSKMVAGEYDSNQAYQAFNDQLKEEKSASDDVTSMLTEEMKLIQLWQIRCAVFTGQMCLLQRETVLQEMCCRLITLKKWQAA